MKHGVTSPATGRVLIWTRQAVSLHRRNTAEDETGMTEICAMSSTAEMHTDKLKIGARRLSALNRSTMKKVIEPDCPIFR
jgi:hypothetical protein